MPLNKRWIGLALSLALAHPAAVSANLPPESLCPLPEEPGIPAPVPDPSVVLPEVGPIPLPKPKAIPPKVPVLPDDGADATRFGIDLYDRVLKGEESKSVMPVWYQYPWANVKTPVLWTIHLAESLRTHGRDLLNSKPKDAALFCPNYAKLGEEERLAFWIRLISAIMEQESTYNPLRTYHSVGVEFGLFSTGLLMLSLPSSKQARFGCTMIQSDDDLFHWRKNMDCGVRIMSYFMNQDQAIASHSGSVAGTGRWLGIVRYWEPLRDSRLKTAANRELLLRYVKQNRLDWLEEGRGRSHPAKRDGIHRAEGEKPLGRILRLTNQMAFCPSGSPDDYEEKPPYPEILNPPVPTPRPSPEPAPGEPPPSKPVPPGCPPLKKS